MKAMSERAIADSMMDTLSSHEVILKKGSSYCFSFFINSP